MPQRILFQQQLDTLHNDLIEMGNLCIQVVDMAIKSITDNDEALAKKAIKIDKEIDRQERVIESQAMNLLLKQQPVAEDLRRVSSALEMICDFERIGDQAEDIAELSYHIKIQKDAASKDLKTMADIVTKMMKDSITAFINDDLELVEDIIDRDNQVDVWFDCTRDDLVMMVREDNTIGEYCLDFLMAVKYLERIGDHTTNVGEWVKYSITGQHSNEV